MQLERDGAERLDGSATGALTTLLRLTEDLPPGRAGLRLRGTPGLAELLAPGGEIGALAAARLGSESRPVRAILFDKSPAANWALGWHQDRTIAVQDRLELKGFGPWSRKDGTWHVEPPFELIEAMVTVRVHLDDVEVANAPLLVAPGSHRLGRVPTERIADAVEQRGTAACLALAGDVWLYATPILHASERAAEPKRRRVLQVDYAAQDLPGGLAWAVV